MNVPGRPPDAEVKTLLFPKALLLIKLRWCAFAASIVLIAGVTAFGDIFSIDVVPLVVVAVVLGLLNSVFHVGHHLISEIENEQTRRKQFLVLFFAEILTDYFCVTVLIYFFGFMYFNLGLLYLPHIILTSIICEKRRYPSAVTGLSVLVVWILAFLHQDLINWELTEHVVRDPAISGALIFALFMTGLFVFVAFLTNIWVKEIVERKNELLAMNRRLIEVDREKQNYTLRATHELKAPFAAIASYAQVILDGYLGDLTPKMRDVMEKILVRCQSLSEMIKNIIQLSNLKTTLFLVEDLKVTNINELVHRRIENFAERAKAEGKKIVVNSKIPAEESVQLIPNLLEILLNNLISNALRYSSRDSTVTVSLMPPTASQGAVLSVKDEGIGIPKENIDKIFEEHYRCENAVSQYPSGNGMGLAIVKEIVRLHQGTIVVNSTVEEGTEFIVTLATSADASAGPHP